MKRSLALTTYPHHYTHIMNKIEKKGGLEGGFGKLCITLEKSWLLNCSFKVVTLTSDHQGLMDSQTLVTS